MIHRTAMSIRTLVVHTGGIGDFLLMCPTLKRLAEDGPLELAGPYRDRLHLAVASGIADAAHDLDSTGFGSVFAEVGDSVLRFLSGFDRVIVWMQDDGAIRKACESAGVRDIRIFPGLPPENWSRHASDYFAECLGMGSLPPLRLPFESDEAPHDVLIHPGSGGARKNWPMDRFATLAAKLESAGRRVEWIVGPAEEHLSLPEKSVLLAVPSLVTLARHLSVTRLYVGNDSGITHLAAACGCESIAIFGPTNPVVWAPRGDHVTVVYEGAWPGFDRVRAALRL